MPLQKIEFMYDIPEGYRFVRYGKARKKEKYLRYGSLLVSESDDGAEWPIVEKIPEQEQPAQQPELKLQYKTQQGDWRDVNDGYEYRIKPKTRIVRFRNYIVRNNLNIKVALKNTNPPDFNKWLGDWQEVEIEENE